MPTTARIVSSRSSHAPGPHRREVAEEDAEEHPDHRRADAERERGRNPLRRFRSSTFSRCCCRRSASPPKIFPIIVRYCCGSGSSKPHSSAMLVDELRIGFLPAQSLRRVGVGDHVEDQEDDHRDREQDDDHARAGGGRAKRPIRRPSSSGSAGAGMGLETHPRFRVERVAQAVAEDVEREHRQQDHRPGQDVSSGSLVISSNPVAIIVPQEAFGGCTPTPRNESADSSSMLLAMLRVKKTMIVEAEVGQQLAEHHSQRAGPLRDRRLDELLLAQGEDLAAQRSRHVGHVDDADDQDRDPDRAAGDRRSGRS